MARAVSDDPSAKNNGGHIGYFTAFQMVYPFEKAAYALKPGELSQPVRTRFGYHLIRVDSIKPNPGEIHVAHIMIAVPRNASQQMREAARDTVYMIWKKLQEGADFSAMAKKYSKDYSSARTGGVLPWFGPGRMIPSFANAAFALKKNGDISPPVETPYGWHIIKRLDSRPVGTFEEMKAEIRKKVNRSDRLRYVRDQQLNSQMKKYHATADTALLGVFAARATLKQHKITWAYPGEIAGRTIFSFRDQKVPFKDFYDYIHKKYIRNDLSTDAFIRDSFDKYTRQKVLNYRKAHLEEEYPEFAAIIKEYSEGMLMFNIMDDKVWSKAVKDSAGLEKFYREHQERYMTPGKTIVERITLNDPSLLKKVMKEVKKAIKKDIPLTDVVAKYNKGGKKVLAFSQDTLVPGKGEEPEWQGWKKGSVHMVHKPQNAVWYVSGKIPPAVKPLKEQLGVVTSDYQDYLEKQWIEELKKKYPVEVNREVFNRLKNELEKESGGGKRQGA
jgi:peptidyl-prolyl cis-trans isomerase SurA